MFISKDLIRKRLSELYRKGLIDLKILNQIFSYYDLNEEQKLKLLERTGWSIKYKELTFPKLVAYTTLAFEAYKDAYFYDDTTLEFVSVLYEATMRGRNG